MWLRTSLRFTRLCNEGGVTVKLLVVSLLHPVPANGSRGVFVDDHIELLRSMGHDVKVVNPLPRMPRYAEARRSTMMGVAKAPRVWTHRDHQVLVPRFFALPDHPYPRMTLWSIKRRAAWIERQLSGWQPDVIVCHTLWPAAGLAERLAERWSIPLVGVVHGYDVDVALHEVGLKPHVERLAKACDVLVCASSRLEHAVKRLEQPPNRITTIPCLTEITREWRRPVTAMRKPWKKEAIDILFPADPRRPEKRHLLALQTGEELEQRGWMVGITSLRHQPRSIVYDRMLVADVTLITSTREAGPLVARESLLCGTPVVSVDVGEVKQYLPAEWVCDATTTALADGIEHALKHGWEATAPPEDVLAFSNRERVSEAWTELLSSLEA